MTRRDLIICSVLTVVIELLCILARFGLGFESTVSTASTIGVLTFGLRIHHGYVGALLIVLTWLLRLPSEWLRWFQIIGLALFVSDLVHHFFVLWPLTGSPQFDLVYPPAVLTLCCAYDNW